MSRLVWDQAGAKTYETGVDRGVLYVMASGTYGTGVAWNGLTQVTEKPTGAEATALYADNIKYLNLLSAEDLEGTIEAYTYPDEFMECDGSASLGTGVYVGQQGRKSFAFTYRTMYGNDTDGTSHGYKLHIVYGCLASPSEKGYETINDSPSAITFSWDFKTTPVPITHSSGFKPTAMLVIDSTKVAAGKLTAIENTLYGTDASDQVSATNPTLMMPDDIIDLLART